ncbi:MAG: DUF1854 domain-containing protein [Lautropia sp.]
MITPPVFTLSRNPLGRLVLEIGAERWENVIPVRSFPIGAPEEGIALVSADGHERVWIDRLDELAPPARRLVDEELASREFVPEIRRLAHVSGFATPCTWHVETDRGATRFVLKGEEAIRRLSGTTLLISDAQGVQYLVRDLGALDRASRKLIDRFL